MDKRRYPSEKKTTNPNRRRTGFDEKDDGESSFGDDLLDRDVVLPDGEAFAEEAAAGARLALCGRRRRRTVAAATEKFLHRGVSSFLSLFLSFFLFVVPSLLPSIHRDVSSHQYHRAHRRELTAGPKRSRVSTKKSHLRSN